MRVRSTSMGSKYIGLLQLPLLLREGRPLHEMKDETHRPTCVAAILHASQIIATVVSAPPSGLTPRTFIRTDSFLLSYIGFYFSFCSLFLSVFWFRAID